MNLLSFACNSNKVRPVLSMRSCWTHDSGEQHLGSGTGRPGKALPPAVGSRRSAYDLEKGLPGKVGRFPSEAWKMRPSLQQCVAEDPLTIKAKALLDCCTGPCLAGSGGPFPTRWTNNSPGRKTFALAIGSRSYPLLSSRLDQTYQ